MDVIPIGANARYIRLIGLERATAWGYSLYEFVVHGASLTELRENNSGIPLQFELEQNHPNPFNPTTEIRFQIPEVSHVTLNVFDLLGREIATLVDEVKQPALYAVLWKANGAASGVYFYRMTAGAFVETRKLVLMK
jgi:hypothetical protein